MMQKRLAAAKAQKAPETTPEPAPEPTKPKKLELDAASQTLLEENPIVPNAGKPEIKPPPATDASATAPEVVPPTAPGPKQNIGVLFGGLLAAGLLMLAGVSLSHRKPTPAPNPMPTDRAPVPFVAPQQPKRSYVEI
jgi:hypothetical protein